jgi:hypothetical protein
VTTIVRRDLLEPYGPAPPDLKQELDDAVTRAYGLQRQNGADDADRLAALAALGFQLNSAVSRDLLELRRRESKLTSASDLLANSLGVAYCDLTSVLLRLYRVSAAERAWQSGDHLMTRLHESPFAAGFLRVGAMVALWLDEPNEADELLARAGDLDLTSGVPHALLVATLVRYRDDPGRDLAHEEVVGEVLGGKYTGMGNATAVIQSFWPPNRPARRPVA